MKKRDLIYSIVCVAMNVALLTICTWISIPLPMVSFTMQTFAVCLIAALFSWKISVLSVLGYLLLGLFGAPVFSGFHSGISAIMGTTGGYLVGFIFTVLVVSLAIQFWGRKYWISVLAMLVGVIICYVFGTVWFVCLYLRTTGSVSLLTVLGWCVFPFIAPDIAKIFLAATIAHRLYPHLQILHRK